MDDAKRLFELGRSYARSSALLYRAAIKQAEERGLPDPERFAFNGDYSQATHYLLGLGLELMLKAAIVAWSGRFDKKLLSDKIRHDLIEALNAAEAAGFTSRAPELREILEILREPFRLHWFRYYVPDDMPLPGNFEQVVAALEILEEELGARIWTD